MCLLETCSPFTVEVQMTQPFHELASHGVQVEIPVQAVGGEHRFSLLYVPSEINLDFMT
jgi:hypothetical protein